MVRFLPIILAACVAIVSGLIGAVGVRALAIYEKLSKPPVPISCKDLLNELPEEVYHFQLTDWSRGRKVFPVYATIDPNEKDVGSVSTQKREWEGVRVCFFPKGQRLRNSYSAVILLINNIHSEEELDAFLSTQPVNFYCLPDKQHIGASLHSKIARKYISMNFKSCVLGEIGGEPHSDGFGKTCIQVGIGGVSIAVIGLVCLYLFKGLCWLLKRKKDSWYDEEESDTVSNRAGLPSV
jgi:hypothetical protein